MKVIICGSRNIKDKYIVCMAIKRSGFNITEVVEGECYGVDLIAREWAEHFDIKFTPFPANWKEFGKRAGHIRNAEMIDYIKPFKDRGVIAVWDGKSPGTQDTINLAKKYEIPCYVMVFREERYG